MKKYIAIALCCLSIFTCACASACGSYILIYDSDTRLLSEEEVRGYHYDTLGYVLNEIVARHGYHFDPDGKYGSHFEDIGYIYEHDTGFPYQEAPQDVSNEQIIAGLSDTELENIRLIKKIRAQKRTDNDESGFHANWLCWEYPDELRFDAIGETTLVDLPINLNIPVYSGPGEQYLRGAQCRAMVSTNDRIRAHGFDGDWLMITYLVNPETKQTRVGYIHKDEFGRELNCPECREAASSSDPHHIISCSTGFFENSMTFLNIPKVLSADAVLTDDPTGARMPLVSLQAGHEVTLLMTFPDDQQENTDDIPGDWAYVEVNTEHGPARGYIPADMLL